MSEDAKKNLFTVIVTILFVGLIMVAPVAYTVATISTDEEDILERASAEQTRLNEIYARARVTAHGPSGRPR